MSDEDDFMLSADEEDYDFEYDDDELEDAENADFGYSDEEDDGKSNDQLKANDTLTKGQTVNTTKTSQVDHETEISNMYYSAKEYKLYEPEVALSEFKRVTEKEKSAGKMTEFGFKALKQIIKLSLKLNHFENINEFTSLLISHFDKINKNYLEKSVNNILDSLSANLTLLNQQFSTLEYIYKSVLDALREQNNERLWIKSGIKLANIYIKKESYDEANRVTETLHESCLDATGNDDISTKSYYLLEIYALRIQLCSLINDDHNLRKLYQKTLDISSGVLAHPRILGVIRECGGKMYMKDRKFDLALEDFFESFKNYDEAGDNQRIQVLKYLILASMLSENDINPFDSQEIKPYTTNNEILVVKNLVDAFQSGNIDEFMNILTINKTDSLFMDKFIQPFLDGLVLTLRSQTLITLIKPYKRVKLSFLAKRLGTETTQEVRSLAVDLILDGRLGPEIKIDDINQYILNDSSLSKAVSTDSLMHDRLFDIITSSASLDSTAKDEMISNRTVDNKISKEMEENMSNHELDIEQRWKALNSWSEAVLDLGDRLFSV